MNKILSKILELKKGNYVHALEVSTVYEIECVIESIHSEFKDHPLNEIIDFFESMSIYAIDCNEETEEEIYNFNISDHILNNQ